MQIICYAKADLFVPIADIQRQIQQLTSSAWKAHLNGHDYEGEWTVLPLRSPGGNITNLTPELLGLAGMFADTPLMYGCPAVKQLLNSLDCDIMSVRLLNLKKGSVIKPHRDKELSFEHGEVRLHFPVFTNPGVAFYVEDDKLDMLPGQCWYINANLAHWVSNNGDTDRIHLVVDCKVNEWVHNLLTSAQKKSIDQQLDTKDWHKIIEHLREVGTSGALAAAADMENKLKAITAQG